MSRKPAAAMLKLMKRNILDFFIMAFSLFNKTFWLLNLFGDDGSGGRLRVWRDRLTGRGRSSAGLLRVDCRRQIFGRSVISRQHKLRVERFVGRLFLQLLQIEIGD